MVASWHSPVWQILNFKFDFFLLGFDSAKCERFFFELSLRLAIDLLLKLDRMSIFDDNCGCLIAPIRLIIERLIRSDRLIFKRSPHHRLAALLVRQPILHSEWLLLGWDDPEGF